MEKKRATFQGPSGEEKADYDFLVGCDGRRSRVREAMMGANPSMEHSEFVSNRSYDGYHRLPPLDGMDIGEGSGSGFKMCTIFHISGEKDNLFSAGFWPTREGTISGNMSAPTVWFDTHPNTEEAYKGLFKEHFPRFPEQWLAEVSKQLVESKKMPNGASVKCSLFHGNGIVILGDAAHGRGAKDVVRTRDGKHAAVSDILVDRPALGQGMNSAVESAYVLAQVLDKAQGDISLAAPSFTAARLADAHALFYLDRNARNIAGYEGNTILFWSVKFHVALGSALKRLFPKWFKGPAHSELITGTVPYSKVLKAIQRDRAILFGMLGLGTTLLALAAKSTLKALRLF